jgi:AcrR family transcriptional regulator
MGNQGIRAHARRAGALLPESQNPIARRVLDSAREVLAQQSGTAVTLDEVISAARVEPDGARRLWGSDQDLMVGLIARDLLEAARRVSRGLREDPSGVEPARLSLQLVESLRSRVLVRALQQADAGLLGAAVDDPRTVQLTRLLTPVGLVGELVEIWRRHELVCGICEAEHQAFSLQCLLRGFTEPVLAGPPLRGTAGAQDIAAQTFQSAVERVLGHAAGTAHAPDGTGAVVDHDAAAADMRRLLAERTAAVHALLGL